MWSIVQVKLITEHESAYEDVKYDYTAELTGAGSRSVLHEIKFKLLYIKFDYYDTGIEAVNSLRPWNIIDLTWLEWNKATDIIDMSSRYFMLVCRIACI